MDVTSDGTIVATDSTSIYGIKDGSDAFTVILTNEAHTIPATSAGVPRTYANSGTDIRVFLGSTALAYNTSGANTFNVTAVSGNDIDPNASPTTVSTYTRSYGVASGMLDNAFADFITYTIVARNGEGTASTFTKIQSFTKGNDGVDADALTITSNTLSGNTRTIAFSDGTSITVDNGTNGEDGITKGVKALYAASSNPTTWSAVSITEDSNTHVNFYEYTGSFSSLSDIAVTDLTFVKLIGEDGDSEGVIPVYASNASGSNKSFSITDDAYTNREYVNFHEWSVTKPAIGDPPITALNSFVKFVGNAEKTVQIFKLNDTTVGGTASSQTYATPVAGLEAGWSTTQPALANNNDKVYMSRRTFTADGLPASGNEISWSTPVIVAERNDSTVPGPNGLRTVQGYLYYEKSSSPSSAPAKPGTVTYTFSTGLISENGAINTAVNTWTNEPRTHTATSANTHWAVRYYGTEASEGATAISIPTGQISSAVKSTVFTGVVTFNGGTLTDGSGSGDITPVEGANISAAINNIAQTTTIDGGKLTTGSISANKLSIGKTAAQLQAEGLTVGSRLLLLSDSLKIFDGTTLRVHLGNLSNPDT